MANVFCYSGATGANNGSSWEDAYTTLAAALTAADDTGTVYLADVHNETGLTTINSTSTGVNQAIPSVISCDLLTGTSVVYSKATSPQLVGSTLTISNSIAFYGVYIEVTTELRSGVSSDEAIYYNECTIQLGDASNSNVRFNAYTSNGYNKLYKCDINIPNTTNTTSAVFQQNATNILIVEYCTFSGSGLPNRTSSLMSTVSAGCNFTAIGCDFSGFTNASHIFYPVVANVADDYKIINCLFRSGISVLNNTSPGEERNPTVLNRYTSDEYSFYTSGYTGYTAGSSTYRTGGAETNSTPFSWLVETTSNCSINDPYITPWIIISPEAVGSAGSKTLTAYIGNSTADLTNAEIWMDIEYYSSTTNIVTMERTRVAYDGTPSTLTDDTSSTWSTAKTYMQSISKSITTGKAGEIRVRFNIALDSLSGLYIDPLISVS